MRVALVQFHAGEDKQANLRRMIDLAARAAAAGAELALFPEWSMAQLPAGRSISGVAERLDGPFTAALAEAARRNGLAIVAGVHEAIAGDDRVFNTVVALDSGGDAVGAYRKVHLYDAFGYRESDRIRAGSGETLVFTIGGVVCGVETCYDLRFPEISRYLVQRGAELVLLPAAWMHGPLKESHWEVLVRARAIENTVYVAAAAMAGPPATGCSMLVDPMGVAVAQAGEAEALVVGEVDTGRLRAVRQLNPSLLNARPDIYAAWQPVEAGR